MFRDHSSMNVDYLHLQGLHIFLDLLTGNINHFLFVLHFTLSRSIKPTNIAGESNLSPKNSFCPFWLTQVVVL